MVRIASFRRLAPLLSLLCLFTSVRIGWAQDAPKPNTPVQQLADQAKAADQAGKLEEALRLYNDALAQARQSKDAVREAMTLIDLAYVYFRMGQPQKTLERYEQALPLIHATGDKFTEANVLCNIGNVYLRTEHPQQAIAFFSQALPLLRQVGNKQKEANALYCIGLSYSDIGQPQKALEFYNQAMPLYQQVGDKEFETNTLNSIGLVYSALGQPQKALEFFNQALPLYRQAGNKGDEAATLTNIGKVYQSTGQPQKALEFFNQALPMHRQAGNKQFEATTLNNIGLVYSELGQLQQALVFLNQALPLHRQVGNKGGEADTLNNIGLVYQSTGQPQQALTFYNQALPLYQQIENKGGEAGLLTNMGGAYDSLGQLQKALEFYNQALPLHRQVGNKEFEAATLNNIGRVYQNIGQPQKALEFYNQALPLYQQIENIGDKATTLNGIGLVHSESGQPQKALEFYNQAMSLYQQAGNKEGQTLLLNNMAFVEQRLHSQQSLVHAQQAVLLLEELRANVGSQGEARSTFLASNLYIYYHCLNLLRQNGQVEEAFALTQKTKARSLLDLLASSRADLNAALTAAERQELQGLQQQAQQLNAQMLKEGVENEVGAKKRFAGLQVQLRYNDNQLQLLTDKLYALHPGLADVQQAHTATVADVARLLPADTALLEYVQTSDKELLLFVVTTRAGKPQVRLYPIVINDAQLQQQCAAFQDACADPRKTPLALSASLSRLLLLPAQTQLTGKTRLIVCPDGPLWNVPFAALRTPVRQPASVYLWQQYELSYAYSATGMQAAARAHTHQPAEHASVLALANPYFGSSSRFGDLDGVPGQRPFELPSRPFELPSRPFDLPSRPFELPSRPFELPSRPLKRPSRPFELPSRQLTAVIERGKAIKSLPGAQKEAEAIHKLFPDAAIYTGKAAQEHIVMEEAGKYKYLHFATHGFFNDASPLLSCIVLAQPEHTGVAKNSTAQGAGENIVTVAGNASKPKDAQTEAEDGLLTARKVFGLHLNADLVTLSACNSGRGQVRTGEGIVGLTWAFFAAGCPSQVVSQWSVDDAATGQLMADFYKGLKQGKSKSAALRNAALKLSKDGKHQHPYYWTPFFLVGDWR